MFGRVFYGVVCNLFVHPQLVYGSCVLFRMVMSGRCVFYSKLCVISVNYSFFGIVSSTFFSQELILTREELSKLSSEFYNYQRQMKGQIALLQVIFLFKCFSYVALLLSKFMKRACKHAFMFPKCFFLMFCSFFLLQHQ